MRLTPEDLDDMKRFSLVEEVAHEKLVPAVQAYLKRPSPVKAIYVLVNAVAFAVLGFLWVRSGVPFLDAFPNLALGMCLGYLVLLPVHEAVHALTYRWLGARGTRIVYTWRNLTAYCVAVAVHGVRRRPRIDVIRLVVVEDQNEEGLASGAAFLRAYDP
ncbi:MAG: hypothetical protein U0790_26940 [Isosphaeraceae bacterium]